ncbi:MAG: hypothetical protein HRT63_04405, partial [Erythrobacter sp.]|nr:hypothetical protein [Erythrobacter sp.]
MRLSQFIEHKPVARRKRTAQKPTIAQHRIFVPMVTIWAAAMAGVSIIVLPQSTIDSFTATAGLGSFDPLVRYGLAGVCGLLGGALGLVAGLAIHSRAMAARKTSIAGAYVKRKLRPIDPLNDLGSASLDAPLDEPASADFEAEFEETEAGSDSAPAPADMPAKTAKGVSPEDQPAEDQPAEDQQWAFTHKEYQQALIESCAASCEDEGGSAAAPSAQA